MTNASSGTFARNDDVKIVDFSFAISDGITLGDTFHIQDIGTYMDQYALLYARKTTSPRLTHSTTVFMWDGVPGDQYDRKIQLPGIYMCSIERAGYPYVFTQLGTTLICSVFDGTGFREVGRLKNTVVSANNNIPKTRVGIDGDFFVLLATSPGNSVATAPLYWNPATGDFFFAFGAANGTDPYLSILFAQNPSSPYDVRRYVAFNSSSGTATGYFQKFTLEGSPWWGTKKYSSNFLAVPYDKDIYGGEMARIQINRIELSYNAPPDKADDEIALTLTTKDEYEFETYTAQTATVKSTTAASTNAQVYDKRAILELGATATELAIDLTVTVSNSSNTWAPIIRRIIIDYEAIELEN